jgi:hypothetical protein
MAFEFGMSFWLDHAVSVFRRSLANGIGFLYPQHLDPHSGAPEKFHSAGVAPMGAFGVLPMCSQVAGRRRNPQPARSRGANRFPPAIFNRFWRKQNFLRASTNIKMDKKI